MDFSTLNDSINNIENDISFQSKGIIEIGKPPYESDPNVPEEENAQIALPYVDLVAKNIKLDFEKSKIGQIVRFKTVKDLPKLRVYYFPQPIADHFSNSLTDTFLSSIFNTVYRIGETARMLGVTPKDLTKMANNMIGSSEIGKMISHNKVASKALSAVLNRLTGHIYMFPKIWAGSSGQLSYSVTTRLICENPSDDEQYYESIVKPIKYLLKYELPRQDEDMANYYTWPYFCSATSPGLFKIKVGMITDLDIEKGSHNSISFNQRPSVVEIKFTITSIYDNVIQTDSIEQPAQSLEEYLDAMSSKRFIEGKTEVSNVILSNINQISDTIEQVVPSVSLAAKNTAEKLNITETSTQVSQVVSDSTLDSLENYINEHPSLNKQQKDSIQSTIDTFKQQIAQLQQEPTFNRTLQKINSIETQLNNLPTLIGQVTSVNQILNSADYIPEQIHGDLENITQEEIDKLKDQATKYTDLNSINQKISSSTQIVDKITDAVEKEIQKSTEQI